MYTTCYYRLRAIGALPTIRVSRCRSRVKVTPSGSSDVYLYRNTFTNTSHVKIHASNSRRCSVPFSSFDESAARFICQLNEPASSCRTEYAFHHVNMEKMSSPFAGARSFWQHFWAWVVRSQLVVPSSVTGGPKCTILAHWNQRPPCGSLSSIKKLAVLRYC